MGSYFPERLDACWEYAGEDFQHAAGINDYENNRQTHGYQHESEAGADYY